MMETKPPLPPFTPETAAQKVRGAEDAWNTRDPDRVVLVYTEDTRWRNRAEFPVGREEVRRFLQRKWAKELDYRLIKELWAFTGNRIAVRFAYEWHDDSGHWFRSLRQRELGVRRPGLHDAALREHQRPSHQGDGAQVPLAARAAAGRSCGVERSGAVTRTNPGAVSKPGFGLIFKSSQQ